jgi:hypothetical protein
MFNKTILDGAPDNPSTQIDDGSPENLKKLRHFAEAIMEENKQEFDHVCDMLVRNRDKKEAKKNEEPSKENWVKSLFSFGKKFD